MPEVTRVLRDDMAQLGCVGLAAVRCTVAELLPCLRARKLCLRTWLGPVQPAREGLGVDAQSYLPRAS